MEFSRLCGGWSGSVACAAGLNHSRASLLVEGHLELASREFVRDTVFADGPGLHGRQDGQRVHFCHESVSRMSLTQTVSKRKERTCPMWVESVEVVPVMRTERWPCLRPRTCPTEESRSASGFRSASELVRSARRERERLRPEPECRYHFEGDEVVSMQEGRATTAPCVSAAFLGERWAYRKWG